MIGSRNAVVKPTLKRETVLVPSLGFEVIVRQLTLSEKLEMTFTSQDEAELLKTMVDMLSKTVLLDDLKPLFNVEEWEAFGAEHLEETSKLLEVTYRLSGLGVADPKKSEVDLSPSLPESLPEISEELSTS